MSSPRPLPPEKGGPRPLQSPSASTAWRQVSRQIRLVLKGPSGRSREDTMTALHVVNSISPALQTFAERA